MGIMDKLKEMMGQHPDKTQQGIDRAGDMVDKRTGNKHADKVDRAQQHMKDRLGRKDSPEQPPPPPPPSA
ncbi:MULTISPECIES: antitoxin [Streptomyces]|uniref:Antitoxin n=1 Tax=Streptomyces lateritius TaxID=67313 RepID=A0ABW6YN59_9ACTN|nr:MULTISPECIES: antitoxin [Streptomyces]QGZ49317.1 antitoxin [Streptomyces sp. QHH-9511]GGU13902.1 kanamycin biosynthetic protein [Streptomyces lateritius]